MVTAGPFKLMARKKVAGAASEAMGASIERTRSKELSMRRMEYRPMCEMRWVISSFRETREKELTADFADDADEAITLSVTFKRMAICSFEVSSSAKGIKACFSLNIICNDL